jgi:hypothetical protein
MEGPTACRKLQIGHPENQVSVRVNEVKKISQNSEKEKRSR